MPNFGPAILSNPAPFHSEVEQNNFHLLRLFAALQVVLTHGTKHLLTAKSPIIDATIWFFSFFPGVPIFFVISGYLVSQSLERSPTIRSYLSKRALRIYPGLWACFGVSLAMIGYFGFLTSATTLTKEFWYWCGAQITLGQFYNPRLFKDFGVGVVNGSLWTIPVEVLFYIILPGLAKILPSGGKPGCKLSLWVIALCVISCVLELCFKHETLPSRLIQVTPLPHLYLFLLGTALQRHPAFVSQYLTGRFPYLLGLYVSVCCLASLALGKSALGVSGYGPPLKCLLGLLAISFAYTSPSLSNRLIGATDMSYGVYLYHMLVINCLVHTHSVENLFAILLTFGVTIGAGWLSWKLVELPALRSKRRLALSAARG